MEAFDLSCVWMGEGDISIVYVRQTESVGMAGHDTLCVCKKTLLWL